MTNKRVLDTFINGKLLVFSMVIDMIKDYNELMNHVDNVIAKQCLDKIALIKPVPTKVKKIKRLKFKGVKNL